MAKKTKNKKEVEKEIHSRITDLSMAELLPQVMNNVIIGMIDGYHVQQLPDNMTGDRYKTFKKSRGGVFARDSLTIDATIGNTLQKHNDMPTKQVTKKQTLVLTIEELYRVIPSVKKLEGYNFKDLKELLVKLISEIESSGDWEFVQYINNKPSYFVVRELTVSVKDVVLDKLTDSYNAVKSDIKQMSAEHKQDVLYDESMKEGKRAEAIPAKTLKASSITFNKLPWET
jgi:hypothetical protein